MAPVTAVKFYDRQWRKGSPSGRLLPPQKRRQMVPTRRLIPIKINTFLGKGLPRQRAREYCALAISQRCFAGRIFSIKGNGNIVRGYSLHKLS